MGDAKHDAGEMKDCRDKTGSDKQRDRDLLARTNRETRQQWRQNTEGPERHGDMTGKTERKNRET